MDIFNFNFLIDVRNLALELCIVGGVFFIVEKLRPAEKNVNFFNEDFSQELGLAVLNALIVIPVYLIFIAALINWIIGPLIPYQMFNEHILMLPILVQVILGAFIMDVSTYWRHRFTHHYMWRFHSIHHSAKHLNWLTSLRLHPIDILISAIFDLTVLHILGFSGAGMAFAFLFLRAYNYFIHANINLQFGKPTRYILASPNFHRWHHALEKEAHDKNFCSAFSLIDIMFGTYYHPEAALPAGYGIGDDQKDYPKTLWGQLIYPFKKPTKPLQK